VRALVEQIRPETRVVAITWVHSRSGVKLPVARIAAEIAARNQGRSTENRILLCVDAVHGFGIEDVTMADLGCDFFVAGCHKWLFGPRGTGIIWAPRHTWEQCLPTIPSFSGPAKQTPGRMMTPGAFHSFEQRWALAPAFDFHLGIGKSHVQARTHALAGQLKRGLAAIPGVRVLTPISDDLSSGIVVFQVAGKTCEEVESALHARGIIATITPGSPTTRGSRPASSTRPRRWSGRSQPCARWRAEPRRHAARAGAGEPGAAAARAMAWRQRTALSIVRARRAGEGASASSSASAPGSSRRSRTNVWPRRSSQAADATPPGCSRCTDSHPASCTWR
jgi:Aminotransferase class-V